MHQAPLEDSGSGLAAVGDGWFVVNVRDAGCLGARSALPRKRGAGTNDWREAYVGFEFARRERPPSWDQHTWA